MTRTVSSSTISSSTISDTTVQMSRFAKAARAAMTGALALAAPLAAATPASAAGYGVDRYAHVVGVDVYDHLNIRRWPAAYSQKVGAIPHYGDGLYVQRCVVRPHGSSSDWCKVEFHGTWGWVNKRYLGLH